MENFQSLTVEATVNAPIAHVWKCWTTPEDIMNWCFASPDWHCPAATNDLTVGGSFTSRMAAKDGSFAFDFGGVYDVVDLHKTIGYTMADGRKVKIEFTDNGDTTYVSETFDAENENPLEMQQGGWQAILNNFKVYTEGAL
ncbi:MAG: SRPBCC family protein [Saprospiraceae bacterium]|nr:SRPBCC family protein [Saprospiraceae bacterium]